ncbi:TonB-dependent siderophore receptor [Pseudomonas sp. PA15(2017)]|uniref:TonB-dependent siderophore receptor n=1 Tax=Pseudomonas sp. PA15(2017) TaxID=1932111 RepID=UPI0009668876|nr:TonB-dependent siderophore receptor [Pseudomonas sp. PA15(2017)]OLU28707.1 TonB-dependent siderophore receptor [Pseudomonas sp. PA15(2017)]
MFCPAYSRLASALSLCLCTYAVAAPVNVDLSAQPLSSALNQLEAVSGLRVAFDPQIVSGKQAPAVRGNLEPAQALRQLLVGSGLVATVSGDTAQLHTDASGEGAVLLDGLNISAQRRLMGAATTEGTQSYTTGSMSTATKLPLSIRETPQSVSVFTRRRIEDQGINDLEDLVRAAPGLTLNKFGSDRHSFQARGFNIDNIMYDGLPTTTSTFTQDTIASADMAIFDRIEVVRGATGLMTGAGSPSATINLVRKRPTDAPYLSISGSAGSWDRYRTEVDGSNKLNDSGTLRGRFVGAYEDNKSFTDVRKVQRQTFYGILEADLNDATTWSIGASYQREDKRSDWGALPSGPNGEKLGLSRSAFLANDWSRWDQEHYTLFSDITHQMDNGWVAKLSGTKTWSEADTFSSYPQWRGSDVIQSSGQYFNKDKQNNLDASLSGPFQLFGQEHNAFLGASRRQEKFDQVGGWWPSDERINIYNFYHNVPKPSTPRNPYASRYTKTEEAVYGGVRLNPIEPLHVILGGRASWYEYESRSGGRDYKVVREVTPYAGVVYDLDDTYSVYASYTEIFQPQNARDTSDSVLDPMTGKSYEIGLKGEYFEGGLNASVALFDMTQHGRAYALNPQPQSCRDRNITCSAAAGEVRSQGIDAELSGALTANWQLSASYVYLYSKYTKDARNKGKLFAPEQPKHLIKVATSYDLSGELSGWRVGADIVTQSDTYRRVGTGHSEQDAYSVVGLMAGYRFSENWDGRVNFNNVFDKKYWDGLPGSGGGGVYGDPRNLMFSLKWTL